MRSLVSEIVKLTSLVFGEYLIAFDSKLETICLKNLVSIDIFAGALMFLKITQQNNHLT